MEHDFTTKAKVSDSDVVLALTPDDDLDLGEHTVTIEAKD